MSLLTTNAELKFSPELVGKIVGVDMLASATGIRAALVVGVYDNGDTLAVSIGDSRAIFNKDIPSCLVLSGDIVLYEMAVTPSEVIPVPPVSFPLLLG